MCLATVSFSLVCFSGRLDCDVEFYTCIIPGPPVLSSHLIYLQFFTGTRDKIAGDERFRSVQHDLREGYFRDFIGALTEFFYDNEDVIDDVKVREARALQVRAAK